MRDVGVKTRTIGQIRKDMGREKERHIGRECMKERQTETGRQ